MRIVDYPIGWYIDKLKNNEFFSLGGYGDGEWGFILGTIQATQYGTTKPDGIKESLLFRSPNYYFASAKVLKNAAWTGIGEEAMDRVLHELEMDDLEFHEKDMWDAEMKVGGLGPLIEVLRTKDVYLVGNRKLEGLTFLNPQKVFALDFPTWDVQKVADEILEFGKSGVYVVAGGPASCILTQRLHDKIPDSWFLHLGSIWDGFVGIGAMRGFRREIYADGELYHKWAMSNLGGVVEEWPMPKEIYD